MDDDNAIPFAVTCKASQLLAAIAEATSPRLDALCAEAGPGGAVVYEPELGECVCREARE